MSLHFARTETNEDEGEIDYVSCMFRRHATLPGCDTTANHGQSIALQSYLNSIHI